MKQAAIIIIVALVVIMVVGLVLWQTDYFKKPEPPPPQEPVVTMPAKPIEQPKPQGESYTVKQGDTLWSIAKEKYGTGAKWELIMEANKDKITNKDSLTVGWVLFIPKDTGGTVQPAPSSVIYHTVVQGDTLEKIALKYYNDASKSEMIFQANRDKLATKETSLQAGWKLAIPK
ncbi:MAG: LysM peptidoglycan-binding domain-containing protein [Planctomycetes bacterium]|nr:LysM peptidoglycan-binding domain-containing protein [Planctomycetota bacterium]